MRPTQGPRSVAGIRITQPRSSEQKRFPSAMLHAPARGDSTCPAPRLMGNVGISAPAKAAALADTPSRGPRLPPSLWAEV